MAVARLNRAGLRKTSHHMPLTTDLVFTTGSTLDGRRFEELLREFGQDVRPAPSTGSVAPITVIVYVVGMLNFPPMLGKLLSDEPWLTPSCLQLYHEGEAKALVEIFRPKDYRVVRSVRPQLEGDVTLTPEAPSQ